MQAHKKFYDSIGIPIIGSIVNGGTIEGGDCLWINDTTLLIGEGYRSNREGIEQLQLILKLLNIQLIPIQLPKNKINENSCFHLMSIISMLDHDLAIGCRSLLPDDLRTIFKNKGIKLIAIPEDEFFKSKTLGVNILALSPRNLVTIDGYKKTLDLLSKSGCKLNIFNGKEFCIRAEGGPTCLTRAILRD